MEKIQDCDCWSHCWFPFLIVRTGWSWDWICPLFLGLTGCSPFWPMEILEYTVDKKHTFVLHKSETRIRVSFNVTLPSERSLGVWAPSEGWRRAWMPSSALALSSALAPDKTWREDKSPTMQSATDHSSFSRSRPLRPYLCFLSCSASTCRLSILSPKSCLKSRLASNARSRSLSACLHLVWGGGGVNINEWLNEYLTHKKRSWKGGAKLKKK